ncbi:MAG TPA: type II secretion system protein [Rubrivivax sp.]|jgi:MSHA pilin protein MshA|nr:type II secretion system protein [Rubrivivax sp.]
MNHHASLRHRHAAPHQAGFTLVELVTVILILGVLAAVALPRYADLQGKAREAKVKAVAGSMKAANGLVKAQAMANSVSCASATGTTVSMEGLSVALNHCYPQALGAFTGGVLGAANVSANDGWAVSTTTGQTGGASAGSVVVIELSDAATPANCSVSFTSAATATTPPVVSTTTTGC